jgi:hypothetical protein
LISGGLRSASAGRGPRARPGFEQRVPRAERIAETSRGMGWGLSFNITNLTNQEPSIVANATGQTIVLGHDALGRRYQLSFNMTSLRGTAAL